MFFSQRQKLEQPECYFSEEWVTESALPKGGASRAFLGHLNSPLGCQRGNLRPRKGE